MQEVHFHFALLPKNPLHLSFCSKLPAKTLYTNFFLLLLWFEMFHMQQDIGQRTYSPGSSTLCMQLNKRLICLTAHAYARVQGCRIARAYSCFPAKMFVFSPAYVRSTNQFPILFCHSQQFQVIFWQLQLTKL